MKEYKMYKQIFSLRLAGYLMMNGFPIKRIHHNLKVKGKDVYLFENTSKIIEFMLKYKQYTKENGDGSYNERS